MRTEDMLTEWIDQRSHCGFDADVAGAVMRRVSEHEQNRSAPLVDLYGIYDSALRQPFAKAAFLCTGLLGGAARLGFTFYVLLF